MSDTVNDQVTSIQRRAAQDELVEDLERIYPRILALVGDGSEAVRLRALDYAWLVRLNGEAKPEKMIVQMSEHS